MFEAGKRYKLEMLDSYDHEGRACISSITVEVLDVDGPLVKLKLGGDTTILNTHSPVFVRATLQR